MTRQKIGGHPFLYPMPMLLVGADVDKKPNFMTAAWGGIACGEPPMISVAIGISRYTLAGIRKNGVFSVNLPSVDLIKQVDYCGVVSGTDIDKVKECGFKVFYGTLNKAPMIEQCPFNLECRVEHQLELGSHVLIIGRIMEVYVSEECLTDGKPDIKKIKPIVLSTVPDSKYYGIGDVVGVVNQSGIALIKPIDFKFHKEKQ